jgi:Right handed beta helix region
MKYSTTAFAAGFAVAAAIALGAQPAAANHPVLVEGNNATDAGPGATAAPPGAAGDYDGDGNVGVAEDTDNATDRIFGTIGAALLAANGGANANGHVIIVGSGRFPEQIVIPNVAGGQAALNGVTILEAAPGVQANIDAVLQGDAGNATRQAGTGITINTQDTDRVVILRNIAVRNFQTGLQVTGNARVVCEDCRFDSNVGANVSVGGNAKLTLVDCEIRAGGMRFNPGKASPNPGDGVVFTGSASGVISDCSISGNTAAGVRNGSTATIQILDSNVFDNTPNLIGKIIKTD